MIRGMTDMATEGNVPQFDKADRLGKALEHGAVSVQTMADELGVSRGTISNYLHRRTDPSRSTLIVWALRTGVPLTWLENGIDPTQPTGGPDGDLLPGGPDSGLPDTYRYTQSPLSAVA